MPPPEIFEITPTLDDYKRSHSYYDWSAALSSLPLDKRYFYGVLEPLKAATDAALVENDKAAAASCALLWAVAFSSSSTQDAKDITKYIVDSLTTGQVEYLRQATLLIGDPDLRSRIAMYLWQSRKDFRMAQIAVTSYLEAANATKDNGHWPYREKQFSQALNIALSLGKNNPTLGNVNQAIEAELESKAGDPTYLTQRLLQYLWQAKIKEQSPKWAALSEAAAVVAETEQNWDRAVNYWEMCAQWHEASGVVEEARRAKLLAGEVYVRHADSILARPEQFAPNMHAKHWLEKAVAAFRLVPTAEARQRKEEVHRQLLECQKKAVNELIPIKVSEDITDGVQAAIKLVEGLPLLQAFAKLATCSSPPSLLAQYRQSKSANKDLLFASLFPTVIIGSRGSTTARQTNYSDRRKAEKETRRVNVLQGSRFRRLLISQAIVAPALWQISQDHDINEDAFSAIIRLCPFIQSDRREIYAKALVSGARSDWLVSGHLLIPQLEHSLRVLITSC